MITKNEIKKIFEKECHDFLNHKAGHEPMPGYPNERILGFYIEVDDIADIVHKNMNICVHCKHLRMNHLAGEKHLCSFNCNCKGFASEWIK